MAPIKIADPQNVFVDTAAWIALLNKSDQLRERAMVVMAQLRRRNATLITTEFVLLEVADALSAPAFRQSTFAFINALRQNSFVRILPLAPDSLHQAWSLYGSRSDKEWGLTDCSSFAAMQEYNISAAFTSDHHFDQAGFVKLL